MPAMGRALCRGRGLRPHQRRHCLPPAARRLGLPQRRDRRHESKYFDRYLDHLILTEGGGSSSLSDLIASMRCRLHAANSPCCRTRPCAFPCCYYCCVLLLVLWCCCGCCCSFVVVVVVLLSWLLSLIFCVTVVVVVVIKSKRHE